MENIIEDRKGQTMLLIAVALGMFMDGLDGSIVNVALPAIANTYGIDAGAVSWVISIYFLVMAGLILIFGRISDKGAIKKVFMIGFLLFSLGSLFCALSPSISALLVSRALQGIGAAMLAASSLMLCVKYFPRDRMGFGLSVGALGSSLGAAMGPAIGGILTDIGSWHLIFIINIPIGIIAMIFAKKYIPADKGLEKANFDVKGSLMLFLAMICGLYALETIPSSGLTTLVVIALIVFVTTFAAFVITELKSIYPVLNLRLFKLKNFDSIVISFTLINMCYMGAIYLLPFYFDIELRIDSLVTGLYLLIPAVITLAICAPISKWSDMTQRRSFMIASCLFIVAFMTVFAIITPEMSMVLMIVGLACMGLVWAICGGAATSRIIENVPEDERGSGSSLMSFFIYFGSALGTTLFAVLFKIGASDNSPISEMSKTDFLAGFHFAMTVGIVIAVISVILAAIVNERKSR